VVIVVGSGLAGLSAAMEAASGGAEVIVVEKQPFVGGNSAKATSGINAVGTNAQQAQGVLDSYELFEEDTMRAAQHSNDYGMVRKLTRESTASVQWLEERTGLSLTALTQCGGHSAQRTHRLDAKRDTSAPVAVGRALVKGLYAALDAEPRVRFMLNTEAQRLLHTREADTVTVTGVRVRNTETGAEEELLADSVVLASGGFAYAAADDTQSMLAQYAPQYSSLPTTSGAQADGSGLRLALDMQVDVVTRDMQHVQIHPT
jgi:succinate dehydrogenase/fumarate reductase flavoprotein subunit